MKKVFVMLFACVLLTVSILAVSAVPDEYSPMGDADLDKNVTICDATAIQRYLADLKEFSVLQKAVSDLNDNAEVDIMDATVLQRELADLKTEYHDRLFSFLFWSVSFDEHDYRYDAEKLVPGVPVTFTARARTDEALCPITYEYRIGDEIIREQSEDDAFTYTFTGAGDYFIDVYAYNTAGAYRMYTHFVRVYEP